MELGASETTEFDKMMGALGMLSGSKAGAQKAFDAASAMYAPVEEANPWEASLRYFLEMGKQASQPGSTVLGSAVGAGLVPLDYLTAKKKEKRDRDQKVASTAFSLAPTLKPKAATYRDPKEYMIEIPVLDDEGKPTGAYQTAYRDFLTAKGFADLQKQGARFKSVDKTSTNKFTKRTLYKPNGSTIDVYSDAQEQNAISAGYGRVKADDFDNVTVYKDDGSSRVARSQTELDTLIGEGGGGWSRTKPAAVSTSQFKRTVYKDGRELTVYNEEDYNDAISETGGWSPEKPAAAGPQGSASERMTSRVLNFVDTFVQSDGTVDSRQLAQFISDVKDMAKTETLTFVEDGVSKTATNPGKDAYDIIEQAYGETVADAIRDIAIQTVDDGDDGDGDGDGDEKPLLQTVVIAGKEYTVFSSKDPSIPKEAVQGIVDSNGGMIDVKIASDILFKDGKYNRLAAIASNLLPGGGAGPSGTLTGDSRTAYQAMKRSIELLLRARSGAAVPPAEVDNYMALYYPSTLDNDEQAKNKLNVLAQYFSDTNRLLSQGKLNEGRGTYDRNKHGIPLDSSVSSQAETTPEAVTVVDEFVLNGVKYKQLSDGRTIEAGAE